MEKLTWSRDLVIQKVGSLAELARRCAVSPQAVDKWFPEPPDGRVPDIYNALDGEVPVSVISAKFASIAGSALQ